MKQKMAGAAGIALAISLLIGIALWSRQPDYAVLFSNLSEKDGGAIVTALQQQNIPYKFSDNGGAILVPANVVHDIRLKMAAQGLPKGGLVGFELMENQKLGISQFNEHINYQRALEGELARSITALAAVNGARVHLAIPKQSAFLRDEQKPTASVVLTLHPGRVLDSAQTAGIVHLVASSVPQLNPANVTVVDQNGELLAPRNDPLRMAGLDPTQLKYVQEVENSYIKRIEQILTPIVGPGNFRAQVAADVDFDQSEQTAETYKPNPPTDAAIRSQQNAESLTNQPNAAGVPGSLTNQPPAPATAPITQPPAPNTPNGTQTGSNGQPITSKKESTVNYEVDKTVRHVKTAIGAVKRLSVAVVVNHKMEKLPDGKTKTGALSENEIKQISDLVREAVGLNKDRGDTLNVASSAFTAVDKADQADIPIWKDPEMVAMGKELAKYLLVAGLAAYIVLGIIKPLIKSLEPPKPEDEDKDEAREGEVITRDENGEPLAIEDGPRGPTFEDKLAAARALAKNEPKLVANLIKDWMNGGQEQQR